MSVIMGSGSNQTRARQTIRTFPTSSPAQTTHLGQMPRRMDPPSIIVHLYEKRLLELALQEIAKSIRGDLLAEDDLRVLDRVSRLVRPATSARQDRGQQVHESAPVSVRC